MIRRFLAGQFARPGGWAGRWWIGPYLDRLNRDMNDAAADALALRPGERALEVGFGGGALLDRLLEMPFAEVAGVDISQAMVDRAGRRFRHAVDAGRVRILLGAADALPLATATIDKACSVNSLYFWGDPAAVLAEFARVVRPGGRLVLCFQAPDQVRAWPGHRYGFAAPDADTVARWMRDGGFAPIVRVDGIDRRLGAFLCLSGTRLDAKAGAR